MKCNAFPNKPCGLLTCLTKKKCLWTKEELEKGKSKIPPIPKTYYPVRFSHEDNTDIKNPKRIYYADTHSDAVRFLGTLRIWGWIKPHKGGMEWEVRL